MKKLVEIKNAKVFFPLKKNSYVKAVNDVSLDIYEGETLGLVGESGCGKTTLGRAIKNIYSFSGGCMNFDSFPANENFANDLKMYNQELKTKPQEREWIEKKIQEILVLKTEYAKKTYDKSVYLQDVNNYQKMLNEKKERLAVDSQNKILEEEVRALSLKLASSKAYANGMKKVISKEIQMIFQDPYSSLNPRMTVRDIIKEGMVAHRLYDAKTMNEIVNQLLETVGMTKEHANRFPHEFSGGQRQRIGIARALALSPKFIVCDEPTSALDVSIQAQVISLLKEIQQKLGLTLLFISHDLAMVKYVSDRIAVMYLGKIVEIASSDEIYNHPKHPYTKALISAIPIPDPKIEATREKLKLVGDIVSPIDTPNIGCSFYNRCPFAKEECKNKIMELKEVSEGHFTSCDLD